MPTQTALALGNAQKPSASVMVNLQPGTTLSSGQVQSIAHLVSSAVPNLRASDVTVANDNGDLLYGPGVQSGPAATLSAAQRYDSAAEASLSSMLDQVVGPGNAAVRVNAVLSTATTKTVTKELELTPKGVPVRSPSSVSPSKQTFTGTNAALGGVLGTNTVTPAGTGKSNYTKTSNQTGYETGVQDVTTSQPPGQVEHESVSVVLSSRRPPSKKPQYPISTRTWRPGCCGPGWKKCQAPPASKGICRKLVVSNLQELINGTKIKIQTTRASAHRNKARQDVIVARWEKVVPSFLGPLGKLVVAGHQLVAHILNREDLAVGVFNVEPLPEARPELEL